MPFTSVLLHTSGVTVHWTYDRERVHTHVINLPCIASATSSTDMLMITSSSATSFQIKAGDVLESPCSSMGYRFARWVVLSIPDCPVKSFILLRHRLRLLAVAPSLTIPRNPNKWDRPGDWCMGDEYDRAPEKFATQCFNSVVGHMPFKINGVRCTESIFDILHVSSTLPDFWTDPADIHLDYKLSLDALWIKIESQQADPYRALLLVPSPTISTITIKKHFQAASLQHHPDKNSGRQSPMWLISREAFEVLSHPGLRAAYHLTTCVHCEARTGSLRCVACNAQDASSSATSSGDIGHYLTPRDRLKCGPCLHHPVPLLFECMPCRSKLDGASDAAIQATAAAVLRAEYLVESECFAAARDLCLHTAGGPTPSTALQAARIPLQRILFHAMQRLHSTVQELLRVAQNITQASCDASDFARVGSLQLRLHDHSAAYHSFRKAFQLSELTLHLQAAEDCLDHLRSMRADEAEKLGLVIRPIAKDGMCLLRSVDTWYDSAHVTRPYTDRLRGLIARVCDVASTCTYRTEDITQIEWAAQIAAFRYHKNYRSAFCDEPLLLCVADVLGYGLQVCHANVSLPVIDRGRPAILRSGEHYDVICGQRELQDYLSRDETLRRQLLPDGALSGCVQTTHAHAESLPAQLNLDHILGTNPTPITLRLLTTMFTGLNLTKVTDYIISVDPWDFTARHERVRQLLAVSNIPGSADAYEDLIRYRNGAPTQQDRVVHHSILTAQHAAMTEYVTSHYLCLSLQLICLTLALHEAMLIVSYGCPRNIRATVSTLTMTQIIAYAKVVTTSNSISSAERICCIGR